MKPKPKPSPFLSSPLRSQDKVRALTAKELEIEPEAAEVEDSSVEPDESEPTEDEVELLTSELTTEDSLYKNVVRLLDDGYAGVVLAGPPGTSKSWFAHQIGVLLADGDPERFRTLQFHPSYQYEDFVEGYVPRAGGKGFRLRNKHLLQMCEAAWRLEVEVKRCVIVIDELSRADPGRVFGESLTYIEMSKRGQTFQLASGTEISIPRNLVFLATMNTLDRGVDEIDIAFERRFARIEMPPNPAILESLLQKKGMEEPLRKAVLEFFMLLMKQDNEYCRIGHTYFMGVKTAEDLHRLWEYQLRFTLEKACRLRVDTFKVIEGWWKKLIPAPPGSDQQSADGGGNAPQGKPTVASGRMPG
jgi:5-methylcytosine-specific restriction protein B